MQKGDGGSSSIRSVAVQIMKNEGILTFFSGLTPRILRLVPGGALQFGVYQEIARWLSATR